MEAAMVARDVMCKVGVPLHLKDNWRLIMCIISWWKRGVAALLLFGPVVGRGQVDARKYPDLKLLFSTDSLNVLEGQRSPDGKWVAIAAQRGDGAALFLGRVGTHELVRLTNDGSYDDAPRWFPSGDRIAFVSNRPNRNGSTGQFGMLLDIDPRSGAPRSLPRQVTLEPVSRALPSPDGKWLALPTRQPATVKLMPAAGGTARTLVTLDEGRVGGVWFSLDGKSLRYGVLLGMPGRAKIEEVALSPVGAKPVALNTLNNPGSSIVPADARFIVRPARTDSEASAEIRTATGDFVGKVSGPGNGRTAYWNADGWGMLASVDTGGRYPIQLVSTDGGALRNISPSGNRSFVLGWLPDGSGIISLRDNFTVLVVSRLDGSIERTVPLPAGVSSTASLVGTEVGLRVQSASPALSYVVLDVRTGKMRTVSANIFTGAINGCSGGRFCWGERNGQQLTVFAASPGTAKEALRTVTVSRQSQVLSGAWVHGNHVAWLEQQGDSIAIVIADNASAPPRALIGFRAKPSELWLSWSNDGRRIAIAHQFTGQSPAISIIEVPASGRASEPRVVRTEKKVQDIAWLPGDTVLVTAESGVHGLQRISLTSGQRVVLNRDDPLMWGGEMAVSPDGKWVAYSDVGPGGSNIYSLDFRRVIQEYLKKK